ncbi:MAG: hypothetical protein ACRD3W_25200, partial [Terriglobales bacterium]
CEENDVTSMPTSPAWVAVYLDQLRDERMPDEGLAEVRDAISRAHLLHGDADPTRHYVVDAVLKPKKED